MPESGARRQGEIDARVEALAGSLAEVINSAGSEHRQALREYALGLIRDETEIADAPAGQLQPGQSPDTNPLAIALLLALPGLLLLLLFAPVGLLLLGIAAVMALWGVVASVLRVPGGVAGRARAGTP